MPQDTQDLKWHNVGEESDALCMATIGVTPDGEVFPVRCKEWRCPICAPINALHEAIRTANGVYALFCAGLIPKFVTITQSGAVRTPEFAYKIIANQWDKFRNRWQYWACKSDEPNFYAAFVEGQGRREGMPHFHVIGCALPPLSMLRHWAVESGLGYEVDCSRLKPNAGTAWYVSKYSTKSTDAAVMPVGFRRVRYSRDWPRMFFRSDLLESDAIVRQPAESYTHWLIRAVYAFGVEPDAVMNQVQLLADRAFDPQQSEMAARMVVSL